MSDKVVVNGKTISEETVDALIDLVGGGIMTPNEARAELGLEARKEPYCCCTCAVGDRD